MLLVRCYPWHVTHDMWHKCYMTLGGRWTFSQNLNSLALMVWHWRCKWRFRGKGSLTWWINYWMNDKGVCRTAPDRPGPLKFLWISSITWSLREGYKKKPLNFPRSPWPRSQDLEPLISLPFVINILKKNNLVKWGSCVGKKPFFYILDSISAKDIDNPEDFLFCETMYKKQKW